MELPRFAELLTGHLRGIVELSSLQISSLYLHFKLLLTWNQRLNLTSVRAPDEIITRHYCESIFFGSHLPDAPDGTSILDFGSGAGFPGVPMAVLRPEWQATLLESHQRKAVFLRESTRGLHNVRVEADRAEWAVGPFDWVVSRAVRLEEVLAQAPRLSSRVGLLIGESDVAELLGRRDIEWSEPIRVPWGERRLCIYGSVPRGTQHS
jgi:16S rRNA (guanine527-N7)-methyltransferase